MEAEILALLKRSMPLTTGQFVASRLEEGAEADPTALERDLADAVALARAEGRQVEPGLAASEGRRRRLAEALAAAAVRRASVSRARARERPRARLAVLLRGLLASAAPGVGRPG